MQAAIQATQDNPVKVEVPAIDLVSSKVVDKLENNLQVLDTVETGIKILSDGKGNLFSDTSLNRWYYSDISHHVSDIAWTFEHLFYLFRAASGISPDKTDSTNIRLLRLAGRAQRVINYYFQKLQLLSKTYQRLSENTSEEIDKISLKYQEIIFKESKDNYQTYSQAMEKLLEVPEIPVQNNGSQ